MDRNQRNSIVIKDLRKSYDRSVNKKSIYAIDGISLEVPRGQFVTLLGPSGCGKTTTLRCVAGLESATQGRIEMGGQVVFDAARQTNVRPEERPIAMVPQSYGIWPHMTVLDNAAFPLRHGRQNSKGVDIRARTMEMLEQVGLEKMADRWATQLSGGQQQRLALARALLGDPEVLLLDEPLSNLDAKLRASLRQELRSFQEKFGVTSLYVTHDQAEALAMSDIVVVMNQGRIEQIDSPELLYAEPQTSFVADFIGSANLLPVAEASVLSQGGVHTKTAVGQVVAARSTRRRPEPSSAGGFVCVRPEDVTVRTTDSGGPETNNNEFKGTVDSSEFLGDRLQMKLTVEGTAISAVTNANLKVRPGETVVVGFPPSTTSYLAS